MIKLKLWTCSLTHIIRLGQGVCVVGGGVERWMYFEVFSSQMSSRSSSDVFRVFPGRRRRKTSPLWSPPAVRLLRFVFVRVYRRCKDPASHTHTHTSTLSLYGWALMLCFYWDNTTEGAAGGCSRLQRLRGKSVMSGRLLLCWTCADVYCCSQSSWWFNFFNYSRWGSWRDHIQDSRVQGSNPVCV